MLISDFEKEVSHAKAVNDCDLSYPIEIYFNK
jgi:hypothetical protein